MRWTYTLILFLLFFLHNSGSGQVSVLGSLSIGDTTRTHILKTNRSDQFIGKVMAWLPDSMVFLTNTNLTVSFPTEMVKSIEVVDNQRINSSGNEFFLLQTVDGKEYYGYPRSIKTNLITFVAGGHSSTIRLNPNEVALIEPAPYMNLLLKEPYTNEYILSSNKHKKVEGEMLGYSAGKVSHQGANGRLVQESIANLKKYEMKPQYVPYIGHSRSLLFLPTGFGMKASEREYRNIGIGINIFSYGLTDHLSTAVGLVTILPYADIKYSRDFGKYVHMSVGGYAFIPFAFGVHGSVSIGTPDYFLNLSYLRNDDNESLYTDSDFESFGIGASFRIGPKSRVLAEFNIMTSPASMYGYDAFYEFGYGDSFSWGYGWFGRKMRFETGLMAIGPFYNYNCFPEPCGNRYHVPIPFIAFGLNF